ncbi:MAG: peptidoglycan-associated lipoprotein Pal [Proteobacteria bacterium]|nr:peptidoglycan-associated lipoprotein Pal [Pseudomonadota bacterium]MBU1715944.1 peptidoglycan-associated lipoprotein Pal [Pseudomonadota bacterium]
MDSDTAAVEAVGSDASMDSGDKGMETAVLDPGLGPEESLESPADTVSDNGETFLEGRTSPEMLPVYFDFDDSGIRKDQVERIEKNATFLKNSKNVKIRIEGNCDERGTDEYNVALGERRAMSAKKYLENLGVAGYRMNTISFGEKRPINYGHDDLSWSQNRRDDFLIIK